MTFLEELVAAQCAWLDTSREHRASRNSLNHVIKMSLDHVKYQRELSRQDAMAALAGKLLKVWEDAEEATIACSEEEAPRLIAVYAQLVYDLFEKEWSGSLAHLTHRRETFEDGYHMLLLQRRGERRGGAGRGQGRKRVLIDPVTLTFKAERLDADRLKDRAEYEDTSYADLLREMLEKELRDGSI